MTTSETTVATQGWIERLVGTLLSPRATFARIHEENTEKLSGSEGAVVLVILVFMLDGLRCAPPGSPVAAWLSMVLSVIGGLCLWLSLVVLIAILSVCFQRNMQNMRTALVSLGWSFAPWMLMAPLFCYQHAVGGLFVLLAWIPGLWVFVLQILALSRSFELRYWQVGLLVFIAPSVLFFFQFMQFCQTLYIGLASMSSS